MRLLFLLLLSADPTPRELRVQRFDFTTSSFDGGWREIDAGFKYGVSVGGVASDGGVMELEACTVNHTDSLVLKRIVETAGSKCLMERLP